MCVRNPGASISFQWAHSSSLTKAPPKKTAILPPNTPSNAFPEQGLPKYFPDCSLRSSWHPPLPLVRTPHNSGAPAPQAATTLSLLLPAIPSCCLCDLILFVLQGALSMHALHVQTYSKLQKFKRNTTTSLPTACCMDSTGKISSPIMKRQHDLSILPGWVDT